MADYASDTNSTQSSHLEEFSILIVSLDDHLFYFVYLFSFQKEADWYKIHKKTIEAE